MALWKISAKSDKNWGAKQNLGKGMFIEMSTVSTTPHLNLTKYYEDIA